MVIVHVGLDRGAKKSLLVESFESLLRDSLIKKGLFYAYSCSKILWALELTGMLG